MRHSSFHFSCHHVQLHSGNLDIDLQRAAAYSGTATAMHPILVLQASLSLDNSMHKHTQASYAHKHAPKAHAEDL